MDLKILQQINRELELAIAKHPTWPDDPVYGAAIVAEECGKLVRAANNMVHHNADREHVITEALHTIVTAYRLIENFNSSLVQTQAGAKHS